jgi:hypothetical protein
MDDCVLKIEVNRGGFGVYICDPEINNDDPKKPWKDPWVEYNFDTVQGVCAFVTEVLPKLKPQDSSSTFDAAFARAVKEDENAEGD